MCSASASESPLILSSEVEEAALAGITQGEFDRARFWLAEFSTDWRGETPTRLHEFGVFGLGSAPPYSPEFIGYVGHIECGVPGCKECLTKRKDDLRPRRFIDDHDRFRTTKAFRRLRKVAPREFDAMYLYCALGWAIPDIAHALTKRAIRLEKPERYSEASVTLLLLSGVHKILSIR